MITNDDTNIIILKISETQSFEIHLLDKLKNIDKFDWGEIFYVDNDIKILLENYAYSSYYFNKLKNYLNYKNNIKSFPKGKDINRGICYYYNIHEKELFDIEENLSNFLSNLDISEYWLYSTSGEVQTFIYTIDNQIYIEISPSYKWLHREPEEGEKFISFDEFIDSYQIIVRFELNENIIEEWIKTCNNIISILEKNSKS